MYEDKILSAAVEFYGEDKQIMKLMEELGELMVAVSHWKSGKDTAGHVAEEMADVTIMLKQLAIIVACHADVERWMMYKLDDLGKAVGLYGDELV